MVLQILVSVFLVIVLTFVFFQGIGKVMYNYTIDAHSVNIRFFLIPILRIRFTDIRHIRKISLQDTFKGNTLFALRYWNRIKRNNLVVISKNRKWLFFNQVIIAPDDPDRFIEMMQERMNNHSR